MSDLNARWSALLASWRVEWRAGMLTSEGHRVIAVAPASGWLLLDGWKEVPAWWLPIEPPDWSDGPTRGALLDQVRERWGDPYAYTTYAEGFDTFPGFWVAMGARQRLSEPGSTEIEALLAALEAAPEGA